MHESVRVTQHMCLDSEQGGRFACLASAEKPFAQEVGWCERQLVPWQSYLRSELKGICMTSSSFREQACPCPLLHGKEPLLLLLLSPNAASIV